MLPSYVDTFNSKINGIRDQIWIVMSEAKSFLYALYVSRINFSTFFLSFFTWHTFLLLCLYDGKGLEMWMQWVLRAKHLLKRYMSTSTTHIKCNKLRPVCVDRWCVSYAKTIVVMHDKLWIFDKWIKFTRTHMSVLGNWLIGK